MKTLLTEKLIQTRNRSPITSETRTLEKDPKSIATAEWGKTPYHNRRQMIQVLYLIMQTNNRM